MQLTDSNSYFKNTTVSKKVFIEGCAGTGKTLMAIREQKNL